MIGQSACLFCGPNLESQDSGAVDNTSFREGAGQWFMGQVGFRPCRHPRLCSDLFGAADPDSLMQTMVQLRVDSSGPASVLECGLEGLRPLIDAGAFPGQSLRTYPRIT